uniref:Surface glycan-binding protein B xyloglucan binding domain-containing protein n=1 Tax=uncultured bacterium contig00010(2014) TaxID=1465626 RepID=A0A060D1A6_9BACT|nr:hypothetical protein [uncultured bacterium contig00010(2014)]
MKYMLTLAAGLWLLASCEQTHYGEDRGDTPRIEYVRPTTAAARDSLLVEAAMGATVALIGDGLSGASEVWFNDQKAKLNPTMITNRAVVVEVPGGMPGEVTNMITLRTKKGKEATFPFAVKIPAPRITWMTNLLAPAGATVTLRGNYFFPDANGKIEVLFPGNVKGTVVAFDTQNIRVTIPEGALEGTIAVTSLYGTGRAEFLYGDRTGVFIDGENGAWNGWSLSDFGTEGGYDGSYIKLEGKLGSWAWPDNKIQLLYNLGGKIADIAAADMGDYGLRFEANCLSWSDTPYIFRFGPAGSGNDVDGTPGGQYHWKPWLVEGQNVNWVTDGWETVSLPFSEFVYNKDESVNGLSLSPSDLVELYIMPFGAANGESELKLWLDNLRIVKIK